MDSSTTACRSSRGKAESPRKDKLAETKRSEREARLARKAELQAAKDKKHQEQLAQGLLFREERAVHGQSKRALKDARDALRKEARQESGKECEHGIWRCRICFPHETHKTSK